MSASRSLKNESFTRSQPTERHKFVSAGQRVVSDLHASAQRWFLGRYAHKSRSGKVIARGVKVLQLGVQGKYAAGCSLTPGLQCKQGDGLEVEITKQ